MTLEPSGVNEDPVLVRRATCPAFEPVPRVVLVFRWIFTQLYYSGFLTAGHWVFSRTKLLNSNCRSADHPRTTSIENNYLAAFGRKRTFSRIINDREFVHSCWNWSNYSNSNRLDPSCANDRLFDCSTWNHWIRNTWVNFPVENGHLK